MDIRFYIKDVYGQELRYPVSGDALLVCRLMGTKTLIDHALRVLEDDGAVITEVIRPR